MRIISGTARGTKLFTLDGLNTRPTAERTKEAIFSMIRFELEGRAVLDLFAGSGQMGLEAVSCGAATAVLCDKARDAVAIIEKNVEKTHLKDRCTVLCADFAESLRRLSALGKRFDLVFLDPPYATNLLTDALRALQNGDLLKPTSLLVCESGAELTVDEAAFEVVKRNRYGVAHVTILKVKKEDTQ